LPVSGKKVALSARPDKIIHSICKTARSNNPRGFFISAPRNNNKSKEPYNHEHP